MEDSTTTSAPTETDILRAFEVWVDLQGYRIDRKGWHQRGGKYEARLTTPNDKGQESSASAHLYTDAPANGYIYDYRAGEVISRWSYYRDELGDDAQKAAQYAKLMPKKEEAERIRREREQEEVKLCIEAAKAAAEEYNAMPEPEPDKRTTYTIRKRVKIHKGVKVLASGGLVVPIMRPKDRKIISYQTIHYDSGKKFRAGAPVAGGVFLIGTPERDKPIGLAEGYATAASIYEAAGICMIVCFMAANLATVAEDIRAHIPAIDYLIFADNDAATERKTGKNTGIEAAKKAAERLRVDEGHILAPDALTGADGETLKNTDWNDAAQNMDADDYAAHLKSMIRRALLPERRRMAAEVYELITPLTIERLEQIQRDRGEGLDIGWGFYTPDGRGKNEIFRGLSLLAARTGGGKTLALANIAARGLHYLPDSQALYITLEEPREAVFYRVLSSYLYQQGAAAGADDFRQFVYSPSISGIEAAFTDSAWRGRNPVMWDCIAQAMERIQDRIKIIDLLTAPGASNVEMTAGLIEEHHARYGQKAIICLDYIQLLRPDEKSTADYHDFKRIIASLKPLIAQKIPIFAAAQMNREIAKTAAGDKAGEFWSAYSEQLREAADLEQAAHRVIYVKIDKHESDDGRHADYSCNFRMLKNRYGARDTAMAMPLALSCGALNWSMQEPPTFGFSADETLINIIAGKGKGKKNKAIDLG